MKAEEDRRHGLQVGQKLKDRLGKIGRRRGSLATEDGTEEDVSGPEAGSRTRAKDFFTKKFHRQDKGHGRKGGVAFEPGTKLEGDDSVISLGVTRSDMVGMDDTDTESVHSQKSAASAASTIVWVKGSISSRKSSMAVDNSDAAPPITEVGAGASVTKSSKEKLSKQKSSKQASTKEKPTKEKIAKEKPTKDRTAKRMQSNDFRKPRGENEDLSSWKKRLEVTIQQGPSRRVMGQSVLTTGSNSDESPERKTQNKAIDVEEILRRNAVDGYISEGSRTHNISLSSDAYSSSEASSTSKRSGFRRHFHRHRAGASECSRSQCSRSECFTSSEGDENDGVDAVSTSGEAAGKSHGSEAGKKRNRLLFMSRSRRKTREDRTGFMFDPDCGDIMKEESARTYCDGLQELRAHQLYCSNQTAGSSSADTD